MVYSALWKLSPRYRATKQKQEQRRQQHHLFLEEMAGVEAGRQQQPVMTSSFPLTPFPDTPVHLPTIEPNSQFDEQETHILPALSPRPRQEAVTEPIHTLRPHRPHKIRLQKEKCQ